ncbi:hypothetical protein NEF87_004725 [Candidatus Lokiarchaeum ossiferum]|uniref:Transcription regulator TrmB N-terminal domain-containing protein n=1 Tax=Candidatus Lokiarchaeum ossiferum TaxID=2951803 RepID=A0ABY6HYE6_9ARCH|nr:hypothetical protein NEF87_004725 [Candidatus Lokiarchaeum sp. B-35]
MKNLDHFRTLLQAYNLSPTHSEIILITMQKGPLKASEILKELPSQLRKKGPWIYSQLKQLVSNNWIQCKSKDPLIYTKVPKRIFQQNLDRIIIQSQDQFQKQKANFYEVLDIYKKLDANERDTPQQNLQIPQKAPQFVKNLVNSILGQYAWNLLKVETNVIIALRKEEINFRFHAIEFEEKEADSIIYGGIIYCQMEQEQFQKSLLSRIHSYNADGRKFQYKLEKKHFIDAKNRDLQSGQISDGILNDQNNEIKSIIEISYKDNKSLGEMITFPAQNTTDWICSVWAESKEMAQKLHKILLKK